MPYDEIEFEDYLKGLLKAKLKVKKFRHPHPHTDPKPLKKSELTEFDPPTRKSQPSRPLCTKLSSNAGAFGVLTIRFRLVQRLQRSVRRGPYASSVIGCL